MALVRLFLAFLRVGFFAIGGAYSFLPLIEKEVVEKYHWLTKEEFLDLLGMAKIFPGAISIKYASYTGYKIAKIPGVIAANAGNLMAPAIIAIFTFLFYDRYKDLPRARGAFDMAQLAVFAMIMAVAFELVSISQLMRAECLLVVLASFALFIYTKINPAFIIVGAAVFGFMMAR